MNKKSTLSVIAKSARKLTGANVNSTCWFLVHQPKLPKNASKLRK